MRNGARGHTYILNYPLNYRRVVSYARVDNLCFIATVSVTHSGVRSLFSVPLPQHCNAHCLSVPYQTELLSTIQCWPLFLQRKLQRNRSSKPLRNDATRPITLRRLALFKRGPEQKLSLTLAEAIFTPIGPRRLCTCHGGSSRGDSEWSSWVIYGHKRDCFSYCRASH